MNTFISNRMNLVFMILSCGVFLLSCVNHSSEAILILFLLSLIFCAFKISKFANIQREVKYIVFSFIAMFVTIIPNLFFNGGFAYDHFRSFNMQIAYIIGSVCLILMIKLKVTLNSKIIMYIICVSAYINGIIGIIQKVLFHIQRVDGFTEIFEFAHLSAVLGLCIFAYFLKDSTSLKERIFFGIAFILVVCVLIFNESRGIAMGFGFGCVAILFIYIFFKPEKISSIFKNICLLIVFGALFAGAFSPFIKQSLGRYDMIKTDLKEYENKNPDTSIGARFNMWKDAWLAFKISPIIGLNPKSLCEYVKYPNEETYPRNHCYQRLHSEFFNTLARKGILGILALLAVWISTGVFFAKRIKSDDTLCDIFDPNKALASIFSIAFMGILTLYIVAGIGNEPMIAFSEGNYFLLIVIVFASIVYSHKNKSLN
ncbi:hypothetical protein BKH42_05500 [Helicobacter sp. 13S00482-2]|uniref:O-antigen ligase family protein n=1 Tax=Helicobacter sp. 13S00482-2 TaxID=1476200 RepID=UPI000BA6F7BF|nr:O-antigen ligase family protein [Helicobacter sp. 13S00482-2]PAF53504.1 hypothetical protein BKH42_05500 [Helicobacter sp. 13S00482-2]